ncbi:MAG: MFS transporter [Rhodospirillales bacterium]|jgi:MFS family permease|nr:MFS transporter [Rhodospirillales bacterium]
MGPQAAARIIAGRLHYAWVTLGVIFVVIVAAVGVRAAPGVLILPLERAFGWSDAAISGAVSLNILLFGLIGPFTAAMMRTIGLKRTVLGSMALLVLGAGLSAYVTQIWQLYLTWGVLVGIGSGTGMVGLAAAVANRWFVARRGFVIGLLAAGNASGQLVFLPVLARLAERHGWQSVPETVALVIAALMVVVVLLLAESPATVGQAPYGATAVVPEAPDGANPFAVAFQGLGRGARSVDFWLLSCSFAICGFSTYGLIGTHLIPFCADHGIAEVQAAGLLAMMGVFDLFGTTGSGWLTDRFDPRVLLFWYYSLRGVALFLLPFSGFGTVSLSAFSVLYGLDWVATVPPTVALTTQVFGKRDAPVLVSWIFAAHQIGSSIAAFGAGEVRVATGSYLPAFVASGVACLLASGLVLRIGRTAAPAAA